MRSKILWTCTALLVAWSAVHDSAAGQSASDASGASGPVKVAEPAATKPAAASHAVSTDTHALTAADLDGWLDGLLPYALARADIAGATLSVVKDGHVLFQKGYGYADVASRKKVDPASTLFRIGSTSKLFTWTAVMQLVERGRIDLDADINSYLDFTVQHPAGHPITMRDLMAHRGGFEEGLKSVLITDPSKALSTEQYLKANPRPIVFVPGAVPAYSNYGTALAGYIVQRVSGEPFEGYVESHIFKPLGMTRSTLRQPVPGTLEPDLSQGYMAGSDPPHPFEFVTTAPAGAVSTTASDMTQFMLAYLQQGRTATGVLLEPATVATMEAPNRGGRPGFDQLTYGFFDEQDNGRRVLGHGGDTVLFHTDLYLIPEEGVGIFYSLNSRGAHDSNYELRDTLFKSFMDRYFPMRDRPKPQATMATALQDAVHIAGRYESSRRIQTGFLSFFYLLSQEEITANPNGTINVPDRFAQKPKSFREVEPNIWQDSDGERRIELRVQDGLPTIIDGGDPSSVLQAVSPLKSGKWNLPVLAAAILVVGLTIILWPLSAVCRRYYQRPPEPSRSLQDSPWIPRMIAGVAVVYLIGWFLTLRPILSNDVSGYNPSLDPTLRVLQGFGIVLVLAGAAAVWRAVAIAMHSKVIVRKLGALLLALAMVDLVWVGVMCKFIGFSVSY